MFTQLAPYCSTLNKQRPPAPLLNNQKSSLFFQETFSFKDENIQKKPVFDCRI